MLPRDEPSHKWLGYCQNHGASRSRWGWWSRFQRLKAASLVSAKRNCNVGDSTWPSQVVSDNSPAFQGWVKCFLNYLVPTGTAGVSFVPAGLVALPHGEPSHKWLGYFQITGPAGRGGVGDRDSNGSRRRRWCRQKEIAASAIQRGRRKRPH